MVIKTPPPPPHPSMEYLLRDTLGDKDSTSTSPPYADLLVYESGAKAPHGTRKRQLQGTWRNKTITNLRLPQCPYPVI
eukprot:4886638-Pyramimonas_sp.AAC.1